MKYIIPSIGHLWKSLFLITLLLPNLLISSCIDEPFSSNSSEGAEVEVKVFLQVPAPALAGTRSNSDRDDYYDQDNVYLLIFNGNDDDSKLLQIAKTSTGGSNILYTRLTTDPSAQYVHVVANVQDLVVNNLDSWTLGSTTLATIKQQLKSTLSVGTKPLTKSDVLTNMIAPQPMIGTVSIDGIETGTQIGSSDNPIELSRSTVKISIENLAAEVSVIGANLINAPIAGYLFGGMPETVLKSITKVHSGKNSDISEPIATPAPNTQSCYLYSFESPEDSEKGSTAVLLKVDCLGGTYYYRISLHNETTSYALQRNCNYIVTIKAIKEVGYATAAEALAGSANNLDYTINVVDASSRDIVSNGQYYLGVSNSEFYYYTDDAAGLKDLEITTITHNAPKGLSAGTYEHTPGLTVTGNPFAENTGNVQSLPLKVTLAPEVFTGTITLKLGNLTKVITVYRRSVVSNDFRFGGFFSEFKEKGYISGKVDPEHESWIKLTNNSDEKNQDEDSQYSSIEQANEMIFVRIKANLGSDTSPKYRDGQLNLFRKDNGGNARVVFHQKMYDIYTNIVNQAKVAPYTYVGTFHRWDETGERLIRVHAKNIDGSDNNRFDWRAFVVTGDFIRLSEKGSKDTGIHFDKPYGEGDNTQWDTTDKVEANGQLSKEESSTELQVTGPISFRVGLTSRLPNRTSKPRYGLIAVVANWKSDKPITRYIYVRQGEEPDYLMRKNDLMGGISNATGYRNNVEMFSPYNLTDPDGKVKMEPHLDQPTDFVKFPSQGGYLYEAVYAKSVKNPIGIVAITYWKGRGWRADDETHEYSYYTYDSGWDDKKFNICPEGYRYPEGNAGNLPSPGGNVATSPIRQSLWLYPQNGTVSETQNFIIGYLADGYYDRRPMSGDFNQKIPDTMEWNHQPTYVSQGATRAYIGALAFNPHNSASLFLPFSGTRSGGYLQSEGQNGYFWTSTEQNKKTYWSVAYGILSDPNPQASSTIPRFRADNYNTDTNRPLSARCVRR